MQPPPTVGLVKGNPVRVRNYTRSCKFIEIQAFISHCSCVSGKVLGGQVRKPAISIMFYKRPRVKVFINCVYVTFFLLPFRVLFTRSVCGGDGSRA